MSVEFVAEAEVSPAVDELHRYNEVNFLSALVEIRLLLLEFGFKIISIVKIVISLCLG